MPCSGLRATLRSSSSRRALARGIGIADPSTPRSPSDSLFIEVGLDYLTLDRAAHTPVLARGQRIPAGTQIGASLVGVLYCSNEPSVGPARPDNQRLLLALRRLVDQGHSVIVVEHDRDASWRGLCVDMGPGAVPSAAHHRRRAPRPEIIRTPVRSGPYLSGRSAAGAGHAHGRPATNA